jgi:hypothetical protein
MVCQEGNEKNFSFLANWALDNLLEALLACPRVHLKVFRHDGSPMKMAHGVIQGRYSMPAPRDEQA